MSVTARAENFPWEHFSGFVTLLPEPGFSLLLKTRV
jgi:hypothetical protein